MSVNTEPFDLPVNTNFGIEFEMPADDAEAAPRRRSKKNPVASGMVLRSQLMDLETASRLKVVSAGEGELKGKSSVLVLEIVLTYGESTYTQDDGRVIRNNYSVGFQAAFYYTLVDLAMKVNLVALSLASQVGLATSAFSHQEYGIATLGHGPKLGVLSDKDGLANVIAFLEKARDNVANYKGAMPKKPLQKEIGRIRDTDADQAIIFALKGIEAQKTLGYMLEQNASKVLDPWQITSTYQQITGSFEETTQPTLEHKEIASDYLNFKVDKPTPNESKE